MSWNVNMMGTPEKVAEELEKHGETLSGQSKVEYEAAASHLAALVRQNFNNAQSPSASLIVKLDANGSGWTEGGVEKQRSMQVKLEYSYSKILV